MIGARPALAALLALVVSAPALAQSTGTPEPLPPVPLPPSMLRMALPVRIQTEEVSENGLSQRGSPALADSQMIRLQQARQLRTAGALDRARQTLAPLLAQAPHHPLVLGELAHLHAAALNWTAIERLAKSERAAQHDSLLLGRELSLALERLGRPREAAQVAIECWIVRATEAEWALGTAARLAPLDARNVREALRRAAAAYPNRVDIQRGCARLEWAMGDGRSAMKVLGIADRPGITPPLRWAFAEDLVRMGTGRDSSGALDALVAMAGDSRFDVNVRMRAARRAWEIGRERAAAPALFQALHDLPPARWNPDLLVGVARGLREAGLTSQARELLETPGLQGVPGSQAATERALADLKDGLASRAVAALEPIADSSPETQFRYAEALFFAGLTDSALGVYKRVSADPSGPFTGAALERMFLIEDASPKSAIGTYSQMAYLDWRGDAKGTLVLADSLFRTLPHATLWAQVAVFLSARREAAGQTEAALPPLLALCGELPGDRLAPLARQRAGDIYLFRLKDDAKALEQYEECLSRYPRAWNAAEVRRHLEVLRKRRL